MATRHINELLARLERVCDIGCAEIRHAELLVCYGQKRTTVTIWRDIAEKWQEILDSYPGLNKEQRRVPLFVGEGPGEWVFVWGEGLTVSEKCWLKDVRDMAKRHSAEAAEWEEGEQTEAA